MNKDNYVNKLKEAIDLRKEGVSVSMIFEGANKEN